jgi:hypothetical protein
MSRIANPEFDRKQPEDCSGYKAYNAILRVKKSVLLARNVCCQRRQRLLCVTNSGDSAELMTSDPLKVADVFLANVDENWHQLVTAVGACALQTHPQRQPWKTLVGSVAYLPETGLFPAAAADSTAL